MDLIPVSKPLTGRKGLVVGIANDQSIAYGCARVLRAVGAELAVTWLNEKAQPYVEPLARELEATLTLPLDVEQPGQMERVFAAIRERWGRLDFALHSIAYAPASDLHGRVADSSREGFARAMSISCHSFMDKRLVDIDDVGKLCAFLVSDAARAITGDTHYVDAGFHILA
ncbi:MAG: SDR family oxidoreductase [Burkholderiales bacterium]